MVKSKIDNSVSYSEVKSIEEQDSDFNATMYIVEIHDNNCLIALGNLNKLYEIIILCIYNAFHFHHLIFLCDGR